MHTIGQSYANARWRSSSYRGAGGWFNSSAFLEGNLLSFHRTNVWCLVLLPFTPQCALQMITIQAKFLWALDCLKIPPRLWKAQLITPDHRLLLAKSLLVAGSYALHRSAAGFGPYSSLPALQHLLRSRAQPRGGRTGERCDAIIIDFHDMWHKCFELDRCVAVWQRNPSSVLFRYSGLRQQYM